MMTEYDFEKTVGLQFVEGRPFSRDFKTDSNAVIINEAAVNLIKYKDPVGKLMTSAGKPIKIVGVIKNVLVSNPYEPVGPMIIMFSPDNASNILFIRLKKNAPVQAAIAAMQPVFTKHCPSYPFEYHFSDEDFEQKFNLEKQVGKLAGIFAVLAVFISCLGLFGLAAFMAERRQKEIGIRKVLGASLVNLWTLLSREFVWLVIAGCLIASPLAFLLMNNWLQGYEYRINIHWWVFAIAGLAALVIALVTVSTQAVKAAVANPVESLRREA
jgi:ABC-type antimicrobial peptide transport system permease subunit